MKIAIIGGGNGGYAAAADLTYQGHEIYFWQRSKESTNALIKKKNIIIIQDKNTKNKNMYIVTSFKNKIPNSFINKIRNLTFYDIVKDIVVKKIKEDNFHYIISYRIDSKSNIPIDTIKNKIAEPFEQDPPFTSYPDGVVKDENSVFN